MLYGFVNAVRPLRIAGQQLLPAFSRKHICPRRVKAQVRMVSGPHQSGKIIDNPSMVRACHILVETEEMIDAVGQQIEQGKGTFAEIAKLVSTCTSKVRGGELGWFRRNVMVKEFEEVAFSNPPGSVVKVKSEFGWHLIKVQEHGVASGSITVEQFASRFGKNAKEDLSNVQLIDCREVNELEMASLPNFMNLPMGEYGRWADDLDSGQISLDKEKETIVMCHHGLRSANFCSFLSQQGFISVRNLVGGIDAYSKKVDSTIPQY